MDQIKHRPGKTPEGAASLTFQEQYTLEPGRGYSRKRETNRTMERGHKQGTRDQQKRVVDAAQSTYLKVSITSKLSD